MRILKENILQELISAPEISEEITKEKKKKEKPVAMSLDEFRIIGATGGTHCSAKSEKHHSVTGLDDFLEWPNDSTTAAVEKESLENGNSQGQIFNMSYCCYINFSTDREPLEQCQCST